MPVTVGATHYLIQTSPPEWKVTWGPSVTKVPTRGFQTRHHPLREQKPAARRQPEAVSRHPAKRQKPGPAADSRALHRPHVSSDQQVHSKQLHKWHEWYSGLTLNTKMPGVLRSQVRITYTNRPTVQLECFKRTNFICLIHHSSPTPNKGLAHRRHP